MGLLDDYSDEFSAAVLDSAKWDSAVASWSPYWSWDPAKVSVSDDSLHLTVDYDPHTRDGDPVYYKSGIIQSRAAILYGTFEARIKAAPTYPGLSPAFWLYANTTSPHWHTEIDVVELTEKCTPQLLAFTTVLFILPGESEVNRRVDQQLYTAPFDPRDDFHTYTLVWTPTTITWLVDGAVRNTQVNTSLHQPLNVVLSLGIRAPLEDTPTAVGFPAECIVDYVRVTRYTMTLRDQMAADIPTVFFNEDEFAEAITHWPGGDPTNDADAQTLDGVVDRDNETNSGTGGGDAAAIDSAIHASSITRAIRLEILASVTVTEEGTANQSNSTSVFRLANGDFCRAVRIVGKDDDTQTVLCTLVDKRAWGRGDRP